VCPAERLKWIEQVSARKRAAGTRLDLDLLPYAPFAERVWELRSNVTSYDAWYVAMAEPAGLPMATLDRKLAGATGPGGAFLLPAT
jgi:predicted nucleic acid-binding protein